MIKYSAVSSIFTDLCERRETFSGQLATRPIDHRLLLALTVFFSERNSSYTLMIRLNSVRSSLRIPLFK
jgi:hypothetical protein